MRVALLLLIAAVGCGEPPASIPADADPLAACAADAPEDPQAAALMAYVQDYLETNLVPGAAVAIARDGAVTHLLTTGSKRELTCEPVGADTRFVTLIGKHLTSAAVIDAVAGGEASWDDRLVDFFPSFGAAGPYDPTAITLHHLLSHTSGWSVQHTGSCQSIDDYFASVDRMPLWAPAGRVHLEMLQNVSLASRVLGDDLRGALRARVLDPLGLDGTFDRLGALKGDFASGYAPDDNGLRPASFDERECPPSEPYLGYLASIRDAGAFVASLTTGQPEALAGRADAFYPPERTTRGGFVRGPFDGEVEWAYGGNRAFGYAYYIAIVPDERFGVVAFMNASHARPVETTLEAIRIFTGRTPTIDTSPPDPATFPALAGTYAEPLSGRQLTVTTAGDILRVQVDAEDPVDLVPARRDNSYVDDLFELTRNERPYQLRFWRDADGAGEIISEDSYRRGLGPPFFRAP